MSMKTVPLRNIPVHYRLQAVGRGDGREVERSSAFDVDLPAGRPGFCR